MTKERLIKKHGKAYGEGIAAYHRGEGIRIGNIYQAYTNNWYAWRQGWLRAMNDAD